MKAINYNHKPEQFCLLIFKRYPSMHEQSYDPSVFLQFCSHPPLELVHSLISKQSKEHDVCTQWQYLCKYGSHC